MAKGETRIPILKTSKVFRGVSKHKARHCFYAFVLFLFGSLMYMLRNAEGSTGYDKDNYQLVTYVIARS